MGERPWPLLCWYHLSYDVVREGVHFHEQGCCEYPNIRFIWTLNACTGERKSKFYIRSKGYDDLNDAIDAHIEKFGKPKKRRVRLEP